MDRSYPRLKLIYLVSIAVAVFAVRTGDLGRDACFVGAMLAGQLAIWYGARLPLWHPAGVFKRLWPFFVFILATSAFFPYSKNHDTWAKPVSWLSLNTYGLTFSLVMLMRLLVVVYASMLTRRLGKPDDFITGLRGFRVPAIVTHSLDASLHFLDPGSHRRSDGDAKLEGSFGYYLKRIFKGEIGIFWDIFRQSFARMESRIKNMRLGYGPSFDRTVTVIGAVTILVMGLRFLKVLPGFPISPGHKGVIIIAFYILARAMSTHRATATVLGINLGILSLIIGFGRYGVLQLPGHIVPGILIDLAFPVIRRVWPKPNLIIYGILGMFANGARFTTTVIILFLLQVNRQAWYVYMVFLAANMMFGFTSGFVTCYLLRRYDTDSADNSLEKD